MLRYADSFEIVSELLKKKDNIIKYYKKNQNILMLLMYFMFGCCKNKIDIPNTLQCIICCSNQRNKLFCPCNHFLTCED